MQRTEDAPLLNEISQFLSDYTPSFQSLIKALDDAQLSHYSSALGTKRITFEIFPASDYVEELIRMLSIERKYVARPICGLRDAAPQMGINPAFDFILYLKRWSGFAEQVMKGEGDNERGIAAARAKLIMDDLAVRFSEGKATSAKAGPATRFSRLMDSIANVLISRESTDAERRKAQAQQITQNNYSKALAAAQSMLHQQQTAFSAESKAA